VAAGDVSPLNDDHRRQLVGTLARDLADRGRGLGVAAVCIGVGQGLAVVLER